MTETWRCVDHQITLTVEGNKRTFTTPPGSIRGMPPCQMLTLEPLVEGEVKGLHTCHIEKVKKERGHTPILPPEGGGGRSSVS